MKVLFNLTEHGVFRSGSEERGERRRRRGLSLPQYLLSQPLHHELGHRLVVAVGHALTQERVIEHVAPEGEGGRVDGGITVLLHDHQ